MDVVSALILTSVAEPGDANIMTPIRALGPNGFANRLRELQKNLGMPFTGKVEEAWVKRVPEPAQLTNMLRMIETLGITVIGFDDERYPKQLTHLEHPPIALFCRGDVDLLNAPKILGVVGARAATGYGEHVTTEWVQSLAEREYVIVSGAAWGIDGHAHRAALSAGGKTIAVLAGGVDRPYPVGHDAMLARIVETGLVVSEMPPGAAPTKWRFLSRNRIIAALAQGTLVVEAGVRSGTLNTARHSITLRRQTFVVPGPITSPASAGCHALLREFPQQVTLVAHPDHVQV